MDQSRGSLARMWKMRSLTSETWPPAHRARTRTLQSSEVGGSVVDRVVAGRGALRSDPPTELDEVVDVMVLLLARDAVARGRSRSSGCSGRSGTDRAAR